MLCSQCEFQLSLPFKLDRLDSTTWPAYRRHGFPSSSEIQEIISLILNIKDQVKKHDDQMSRLFSAMSILQREREELKKRANEYKSTIAPVHRLPDDILIEIFSLVKGWPSSHPSQVFERASRSTRPRTIVGDVVGVTHVCGRWRDIAISTKSFWATLKSRHINRHNSPIPFYLERSLDHPLTIELHRQLSVSDRDLLIEQCARWRRLIVSEAPTNIHAIRDNLPILEELSLNGYRRSWKDVFENAPGLHSLTIDFRTRGTASDSDPCADLCMPWSQISESHPSRTSLSR